MKENTGRLAGKVAIVTGGNSGMGASTVELFVKEGSRVMIAARGEEAGQTLADRLGQNAHFIRTDVSVEADVKALVEATVEKWGGVDVLFNNAGIGQPSVSPEEFTVEDFNQVLMINLGSCFLGLKYLTTINRFWNTSNLSSKKKLNQWKKNTTSQFLFLKSLLLFH